jgi:hypothetical protein
MKTEKTYFHNGKFWFLEGDQWPEEPEYGKLTSDTLEKDKLKAIQYAGDLKGALSKAVEFEDQKAILSLVVSKVFPRDITEGLYSIPEQEVEVVEVCEGDGNPCGMLCHECPADAKKLARIVQKEVVSHPTNNKIMSRLMEEPKQHIHDKLVGELNEMSIRIKIWDQKKYRGNSTEQQNKILEARKRHPEPTWEEVLNLIDRSRDEMNRCTKPYKIH